MLDYEQLEERWAAEAFITFWCALGSSSCVIKCANFQYSSTLMGLVYYMWKFPFEFTSNPYITPRHCWTQTKFDVVHINSV